MSDASFFHADRQDMSIIAAKCSNLPQVEGMAG